MIDFNGHFLSQSHVIAIEDGPCLTFGNFALNLKFSVEQVFFYEGFHNSYDLTRGMNV